MENIIKQAKSDIFKAMYSIINFYIKKGAKPDKLKKYYKNKKRFNELLEDIRNKGVNLVKDDKEYEKLVRETLNDMLDDFIAKDKDKKQKSKMKHIKEFYSFEEVNELFGFSKEKEGDAYATKIIDIIEKENIPINWNSVEIDGEEYIFKKHIEFTECYLEYKGKDIEISKKVYNRFLNLYWEQQDEEKQQEIKGLPDLSDLGRDSKKYNV